MKATRRNDFVDHVCDLLAPLGEVHSRAMFGGHGIYIDRVFCAIVAYDTLYFKVDDGNRADFEALGYGPFKPFEDKGMVMSYYEVPADVIEFLARTINRNVRELVGGLNKLIAYAQLTGQEVSLQLAEEQLTDILSANRRRITIDEIQRTVCQFYRIDRAEMSSKRRARAVVRPRQVAMYLAKVLTPRSYPEIGRKFGGRDHSTVIHAVRLSEDLRKRDADMDGDVRSLLRQLET